MCQYYVERLGGLKPCIGIDTIVLKREEKWENYGISLKNNVILFKIIANIHLCPFSSYLLIPNA